MSLRKKPRVARFQPAFDYVFIPLICFWEPARVDSCFCFSSPLDTSLNSLVLPPLVIMLVQINVYKNALKH